MSKAEYKLRIHGAAEKELAALDTEARDLLTDRLREIQSLQQPLSANYCKQLETHPNLFRVQVPGFRAICHLDKPAIFVAVVDTRQRVYDRVETAQKRLGL